VCVFARCNCTDDGVQPIPMESCEDGGLASGAGTAYIFQEVYWLRTSPSIWHPPPRRNPTDVIPTYDPALGSRLVFVKKMAQKSTHKARTRRRAGASPPALPVPLLWSGVTRQSTRYHITRGQPAARACARLSPYRRHTHPRRLAPHRPYRPDHQPRLLPGGGSQTRGQAESLGWSPAIGVITSRCNDRLGG
jgi:hypothetical protein